MKQNWTYYKIKWTAFFITLGILGAGFAALLILGKPFGGDPAAPIKEQAPLSPTAGHYTNEDFSKLLAENLKDLDFLRDISFEGEGEGTFLLKGTLKDADRLMAACPELKVYKILIQALEGEALMMRGHLGEKEDGNGRIIADTLTFADYHISAGEATHYIEQYTAVNDLFAVPFREISLGKEGITFAGELPAFIRTA